MAGSAAGAAQSTNDAAGAGKTGEAEKPGAGAAGAGDQAGKGAGDGKAGEQKPGDGKAGEGEGDKKGAEGQQGQKPEKQGDGAGDGKKAPAKYELKVPDDAKRNVADDDLQYLEGLARENDWTNEEAQAELDGHIERAKARVGKVFESWEAQTKADKELGGENLAQTQKYANQAIDRVFPEGHARRESFLAFLKESGGGVNVNTVAFLAEVGRLMGEDTGTGGRTNAVKGDAADVLYDHPSSKKLNDRTAG